MRVPPFETGFGYLRAVGLVIAGMVIGAALFLSIYNQRLNMMIVENRELLAEKKAGWKARSPICAKRKISKRRSIC